MGSPTGKYSQQQHDGLEDGEWRVPQSEEDKGNSSKGYHAQRHRPSSHENPSSVLHRRYKDYHRGDGAGSYRERDMDQRRGSLTLPHGRSSSGPLRIGRRGPPLSARGTQVSSLENGRGRPSSHDYPRPRFSMNPYHGHNKDPGSRYPSYKTREYEFSPRKRDIESGRDAVRTPFSSKEYQESMSRKAASDEKTKTETAKEKEPSLKRLGTVDILKSIKELEDKKEGATKEINESEAELSMLKASLPKLIKAVEKVSRKAPLPPKSPTSLDVSDDSVSMDESDSDDSEVEASRSRGGNRSKQIKSKSLQKNIESLAPQQRRLISALGKSLRTEYEKSCQTSIVAQNTVTRGKVEHRFQRLYPAGYHADKEGSLKEVKKQLNAVFENRIRVSDGVYHVLRKDHVAILREQVLSGIRYRFAFEKWREDALHISSPVYPTSTLSVIDAHANDPGSPLSRSMSRGRNRGVVRSDLEERVAIATLQAVESVKTMTTLPTQVLCTERSARWVKKYYDWNRILKNPSKEFDKDDIVRPWSKREKDIFAEKFLSYHKDFARIALYLPSRTIPEIIKFYYAVQRSQEFEVTRRKWQLRKRREKAEESALQRTGTASSMGSLPGAAIGIAPLSNTTSNITEGTTKTTGLNMQMEDTSAMQTGRKKAIKRKKANVPKETGVTEPLKIKTYFTIFPEFVGRRYRDPRKPVDLNSLHGSIVHDMKLDCGYINEKMACIASTAPFSLSTSNLEKMVDNAIPRKAAVKTGKSKEERKKKSHKSSGEDAKSVGRGRLPSVDTDKKYIEAVQIYGKDFPRIASYMNKTVEAARKYWERHSKRLGLLSLLQSDDESPEDVLDYSVWSAVMESIQESNGVLDESLLRSVPSKQWEYALSALDHVPHALDTHHISAVLIPELCEGSFKRQDDIFAFVKAIHEYFSTGNLSGKKKRQRDRPVWSDDDKKSLVDAFEKHGKNWGKLQESVPSKTLTQIKNFYQNYKFKYFNDDGGIAEDKDGNVDSPTEVVKKQKTVDDSVPEITIPQEMLASLPQGILDQMEKVMTNPTARMQFNALVMMQQQASAQESAACQGDQLTSTMNDPDMDTNDV